MSLSKPIGRIQIKKIILFNSEEGGGALIEDSYDDSVMVFDEDEVRDLAKWLNKRYYD